ncbi:protein kinase domain-containing protein [Haloferula sargassicola]|uniref:Serine/threonine-protein kinase PknD n=1 Tax=Haloferula sargassicola TaxID=490096 RepID=A0ABP9UTP5_9BACT
MNTQATCPQCGRPLPEKTTHGLCPACLLGQAMASRTFASESDDEGPPPPPTPEEIQDRFPSYEVVECLGRGGMGIVYKARQKSLDRWVAIKVLVPGEGDEGRFAERFEREAKTLAKMSHPNIVTIFDHGETGGLYYIVMEYVDGVNLRDLLREGKMEAEQALAIVPPICEALEYAHGKGVVHRDIKPENLLLDRDGRVKIADFGIASLVGATGERAGTPPYMAPEQGKGDVDRRADIYALGVVLYEMLTGERPTADLVEPSRKVQVDVKIDEMVLRALEKEPERRYQTAGEFRTVVETMTRGGRDVPQAPKTRSLPGFRSSAACALVRWGVGLGSLGFLGFLGKVEGFEGWQRLFGMFGFLGLVGLAAIIEMVARRRKKMSPSLVAPVAGAVAAGIVVGIVLPVLLQSGDGGFRKLSDEGWKLWQSGRPTEARAKFEEAVKLRSDDAKAWNGLGWACLNSGDPDSAEEAFDKVLALEPGHPAALNGLGQIALSKRDDEQAERYLHQAADRNATAAWFGLARLYLLQGRYDEAEEWARRLDQSAAHSEDSKRLLEEIRGRKSAMVSGEEIKDLAESFDEAQELEGNQIARERALDAALKSASSLVARPITLEARVWKIETERVRVRFFPSLFQDSDDFVPQLRFVAEGAEEPEFYLSMSGVKPLGGTSMGGSTRGEVEIGPWFSVDDAGAWKPGDLLTFRGRIDQVKSAPGWDGFTDSEPRRPKQKTVPGLVVSQVEFVSQIAGPDPNPPTTRDQVLIEDAALRMTAAIRDKDEAALKELAVDRIPGWRDALPAFAFELRERFRQVTGREGFDLKTGESMVKGDLGVVRCVGAKELGGKCVVMSFVKTKQGWKNCLLRTATENVPLDQMLGYLAGQLEAAAEKREAAGNDERPAAEVYLDLVEELATQKAGGLGHVHPNVRSTQAKLKVLRERHPELPDEATLQLAQERLTKLMMDQTGRAAEGLGTRHPDLRPLNARIAALEALIAEAKRRQ